MAQYTGYICDRRGCGVTADGKKGDKGGLPEGWLSLSITTDVDVAAHKWELCSDACLAVLAIERHEAKIGKRFIRPKNKEQATDG